MTISPVMAASLLNFVFGLMNSDQKIPRDGKDPVDFSSLIKRYASYEKTADGAADAAPVNKKSGKRVPDTAFYLETLQKGLLKEGKSPDRVYVNKNDSHMLADFLRKCGFPETKMKECIARIFENRTDGMIKLSDFIAEAEKLRDSEKKKNSPVILDVSAVPKMESILIGSGLSLMESGNLLSVARTDGGGLDIDKLIAGLKGVGDFGKEGRSKGIQKPASMKEEKETGIRASSGMPAGKDELIAALERLRNAAGVEPSADDGARYVEKDTSAHKSGGERDIRSVENVAYAMKEHNGVETDNAGRVPPDVKALIDRIIEKSTEGGGKFEPRQAGMHVSESWITKMEGVEKRDGSERMQEGAVKGAHTPGDGRAKDYGKSLSDEPAGEEKLSLHPELKDPAGHENGAGRETGFDRLIPSSHGKIQEGSVAGRNESFASKIMNHNGVNSFPPEYTMDRLGMQIAQSMAKGDGVIRLQLTPPELGTVNLSMKLKENSLYLGIIAENISAKELLVAGYNDLKNSLADQGIRLATLDVQVGQDSGRSFMNLNDGSEREHNRYQNSNGELFPDSEIPEDLLPGRRRRPGRDYLLDLEA